MKFSKIIVSGLVAFAVVGITTFGVSAMSPSPLQKAEDMFQQTSESLVIAKEAEKAAYEAHQSSLVVVETTQQLNNSYRCVIASIKQGQGEEVSDPSTIEICNLGK